MFTNAIYPEIEDFALFANGNWDAAAEQTMIAIAVFCNDRAIFERVLRYYCNGGGDGARSPVMSSTTTTARRGRSGRDQQHTQLGLGLLGDCCQVAWNQGLDLYGYADNRLLKGFEYTAKYLLGQDAPFTPMIYRTGKYPWDKISQRSPFRPVYEQIYNHYVNRAGALRAQHPTSCPRTRPPRRRNRQPRPHRLLAPCSMACAKAAPKTAFPRRNAARRSWSHRRRRFDSTAAGWPGSPPSAR